MYNKIDFKMYILKFPLDFDKILNSLQKNTRQWTYNNQLVNHCAKHCQDLLIKLFKIKSHLGLNLDLFKFKMIKIIINEKIF